MSLWLTIIESRRHRRLNLTQEARHLDTSIRASYRLRCHDHGGAAKSRFGYRFAACDMQLGKAVIASTIGTTIEWYDFFITARRQSHPALGAPARRRLSNTGCIGQM
jgi:hypothetical protein